MSKIIALIPLRAGSKGIKNKNIKYFNGKPLCYWSIKTACEVKRIDEVYISSDSDEILNIVENFNFSKVKTFLRNKENSTDESSTESAMIEIINKLKLDDKYIFILIQATSPFTTPVDIDNGLNKLQKGKSIVSVSPFHRFIWTLKGPVNYDYFQRKRRQYQNEYFIENGAFYINYIDQILKHNSRLSGKVELQVMSEEASIEIDSELDWDIAEYIHSRNLKSKKEIKLFLTDLDGVLTDGGVYCSEESEFLKKFNVRDGMGFQLLRENGIKTGIVTSETSLFSDVRASKIKADYLIKGESFDGKLQSVIKICKENNFDISEVAYIGDDLNCFKLLNKVGYAGCPNDAVESIKNIKNIYVSNLKGGEGCVRDFIDKILDL